MKRTRENTKKDLFGHPEVKVLMETLFGNIEHESDRGSVLIAQEIVDNELTALLSAAAPEGMTAKKVDSLLNYPGVLSSFAAKADVAYLAGLISINIFDSCHILRKIRNSAAHESKSFSLEQHRTNLVEIYRKLGDFGETPMEDVLRYFAIKSYLEPLADSFLERQKESELEAIRSVFKDRDEVIRHIGENPDSLQIALDKLAKVELGIAMVLLCGMIIFSREKVLGSPTAKNQKG